MTDAKPLRVDAQRNREALIAKAREIFDTGGFFDLRFDDFARLAGVGTGTLYRHFPTREALAEAVYHEEVAALCDRARQLQATLPAEEALAAFLRGMVDHMHAHQGLARTLAALMATRSDALAEGGQALERAVTDLITSAVRGTASARPMTALGGGPRPTGSSPSCWTGCADRTSPTSVPISPTGRAQLPGSSAGSATPGTAAAGVPRCGSCARPVSPAASSRAWAS
jgi:AcrR family transcriptional regulator